MEIEQFINEKLEAAARDRDGSLAIYRRKKSNLEADFSLFELLSENIPDTTDTMEKLEKANGRTVIITAVLGDTRPKKFDAQPLSYSDERVNVGAYSVPLISGYSKIVSITDAQTGEVIFNNRFLDQPKFIQKAILFGKKNGLEEYNSEMEMIEDDIKEANERYNETEEALKKIPEWIKRGAKLIFPEKLEKWKECVCYRASDLYNGEELENALQIMQALSEGKSVADAEKLFDPRHSGISYEMTRSIVLNFSKRGPEFVRETQDDDFLIKNGEYIMQIEIENKTYAANEAAKNKH